MCFLFSQDSYQHQILFRYLSKTKGACCLLRPEWDSKHRYGETSQLQSVEKKRDLSATHLVLTFTPLTLCLLQRDKSVEVSSGGGMTTVPSVTSHPEEPSDLEELEQFARTFKQRRIKLGFTQVGRDTYDASVSVTLASSV